MFSITKKVKMKKLYCVICGKYRKFEKPKIYVLEKSLDFSIIYSNCKNEDEKLFKEEEGWVETLKVVDLFENILSL